MPSSKSLLDTTVLTAIMKEFAGVMPLKRAPTWRNTASSASPSSLVMKILCGLKAKEGHVTQIAAFDHLCSASGVLPLTDEIIVKAANVYAGLKRSGELISDGDILIGATALVHNLAAVTDKVGHPRRMAALSVEKWLRG